MPQRLGDARDTPTATSRGRRQAHLEGFDLHANVWVGAHDRAGLESVVNMNALRRRAAPSLSPVNVT